VFNNYTISVSWIAFDMRVRKMIANMKIYELKKRIVNLLELEAVAANKTIKIAQKKDDKDVEIVAQSYVLGIERIQFLINNLFKEFKSEK
jgi:hypothetical protein